MDQLENIEYLLIWILSNIILPLLLQKEQNIRADWLIRNFKSE